MLAEERQFSGRLGSVDCLVVVASLPPFIVVVLALPVIAGDESVSAGLLGPPRPDWLGVP